MTSSGIAGLGLPIAGSFGHDRADTLWKSLQDKLTQFINANGGEAKRESRISERIEWRYVYYRYRQSLERVYGKGAGVTARSSTSPMSRQRRWPITHQGAVSQVRYAAHPRMCLPGFVLRHTFCSHLVMRGPVEEAGIRCRSRRA